MAGGDEPERAELPGGGRQIFPARRVVAFYGAPQDEELGVLGIGTPDQAAQKLERQARPYARPGRPVLPAFELIATVAANAPGDDGLYRTRQDDEVIRRYLRAARRAGALLLLDIQPGRADFLTEAQALERWLREPDVSLALDPEWRMDAGEVPGQTIGEVDAEEVNAVSAWLAGIVRRGDLPQKLLLVHRFTEAMVERPELLTRPRGIAMTLNVDGFGTSEQKVAKYRDSRPAAVPGRLQALLPRGHRPDDPARGARAEAAAGLRGLRVVRGPGKGLAPRFARMRTYVRVVAATSSSTATPPIRSSTGHRRPRSLRERRPSRGTRRWRSPTTTGCTERWSSPGR